MIVRNYPITTDNVRNVGGKDMILTHMVNHYSALSKAKPVVDTKTPFLGVKKTPHEIKGDLYRREQFLNVREAYKKVSNVKHYVDDKEPSTYNKKLKNCYKSAKEKYANIEHLRTLKAMSKRILAIGKMHERKKNRFDPIYNPTYFFLNAQNKHDPKNEATKLISLKKLNEQYKIINEDERKKLLLGDEVYEAIDDVDVDKWWEKPKKKPKRPKSAANKYNVSNDGMNNKNKKGTNPISKEYDPEKFIKIHKFNRENEGDKIMQKRQKQKKEEEKKNKIRNSNKSTKTKFMTLKEQINKGLLLNQIPIYIYSKEKGEDYSINEFKDNIRQFIIQNRIFRDEDFDVLTEELVKKNENNKISRAVILKIISELKNELDN